MIQNSLIRSLAKRTNQDIAYRPFLEIYSTAAKTTAMAKLYLVRHGQASFGADDYDKLSELGVRQSGYIPQHFAADIRGHLSVWHGTMQRQRDTAMGAFPDATPVVTAGLNEFDHMNVLSVHQPAIHDREKMTAIIMQQSDPRGFMEQEFRMAMSKWMQEEGTTSYHEPFRDFRTRVQDTMSDIMATARRDAHKHVVAVTSGGVIALYMTILLDMPELRMADLNQHVVNTSVTSLLFNDKRSTLSYYNNYSHLPADMVTFI